MFKEDKEIDTLYDFENQIRLDALTLEQALYYKRQSGKQIYAVGYSIGHYSNTLRDLGFSDMWQLTDMGATPESKIYLEYYKGLISGGVKGETAFVYAYIDYVIKHTEADVMAFLPERSHLIALGSKLGGYTYDEIKRMLHYFPRNSERIHFVTGLYKYSPKQFESLVNIST